MKASLVSKLDNLLDRYEEIGALLSDPEIIGNQDRFRGLSQEYAEIESVVQSYGHYRQVAEDLAEATAMLSEDDADMREMAEEEVKAAKAKLETLEVELQTLLLPKGPNDSHNVFLEIRAGTGGDEAAIFAGDLFRMYSRYAERKGWRVEVLSERQGEHGGYKEIISRVAGQEVYGSLNFDCCAHRVQRAPET